MSHSSKSMIEKNLDYTLFSWSKQEGLSPIPVAYTNGSYVVDTEGKRYLDFSSQLMNVNLGHNHPDVNQAIRDQLEKVSYVFPGMATAARGDLGERLAKIAPGHLNKTFFTPNLSNIFAALIISSIFFIFIFVRISASGILGVIR